MHTGVRRKIAKDADGYLADVFDAIVPFGCIAALLQTNIIIQGIASYFKHNHVFSLCRRVKL